MPRLLPITLLARSPRLAAAGALLLAVALAVPPGLSCKTAAQGVRPANAVISPEWESLNIQSLAFVGVGSSVGEEVVRQTAEVVVEEQLTSSQDRFVVLGLQTARGRAVAAGAGDVFDRLAKVWRDQRMADKFLVAELCQKTSMDGLLFADLTEWTRERLDFTQEGTSFAQVGMRLVIVSGKTGLPVWEAQKMIRRDTVEYAPGGEATGVTTDESGVSRAQRTGGLTPEPPRAEEVLLDVLASLFAAFPPRPAP